VLPEIFILVSYSKICLATSVVI